MNLQDFFSVNPKCAMGFSGGVDSAYLLYAAKCANADIQPYYIKTAFQPQFEYEDAVKLCKELKITLKVIEYDILSVTEIKNNPENRCYYCKLALFSRLKQAAKKDGYAVILDGTNASDNAGDRPGMKALFEMSVRSPLRECRLTKNDIRALSNAAGLFTWNKPAYACLATRIPTGREITKDLLNRVEQSEIAMSSLGFSDFRIRVYENAARIQIKAEQFAKAVDRRENIVKSIKPYFDAVLLDMEERK